jgi:hypothetical protein
MDWVQMGWVPTKSGMLAGVLVGGHVWTYPNHSRMCGWVFGGGGGGRGKGQGGASLIGDCVILYIASLFLDNI